MTTDPRIVRLKTPEACEQFAINVEKRGKPDLANEARRHAVELLAGKHGAATPATLDGWQTTYAYEIHVLDPRGRAELPGFAR